MTKQSMKEYVYQTVKAAIYKQKLAPGQKLVENEISESLSISRTPIRQAFSKLQEEGFLTISPNKGAHVINPTVDEISEAFTHRKQLELLASNNIMEWITTDDIAKLKELNQLEKESYQQSDFLAYMDMNKAFHSTLIEGCNNRFLKNNTIKMINQTHIYLALYDHFYHNISHQKKDTRGSNEHQMLVNYLIHQDQSSFSSLLATHISTTIDEYKTRVKSFHQARDLFS
ncbi:GntR family transcriptional regulator [Ornithinibacillus sp. L9]|uniref:GntR family transcriptional regulator n=1 Tax=Ornithinibacillus caprae TaxID=2678566 RepID=A0A6N8FGG8_9BACI|nr:GntR family transcriptional regulator [Ornithinibacillus caprae]MUK87776.1 GntR family transcriptional regulator [Ornithinibacillus caprae]